MFTLMGCTNLQDVFSLALALSLCELVAVTKMVGIPAAKVYGSLLKIGSWFKISYVKPLWFGCGKLLHSESTGMGRDLWSFRAKAEVYFKLERSCESAPRNYF